MAETTRRDLDVLAEALLEADVVTRPPTRQELEEMDPDELERLALRYMTKGAAIALSRDDR